MNWKTDNTRPLSHSPTYSLSPLSFISLDWELFNFSQTLPPDLKLQNSDVTEVTTQKFIESIITLLHIMNSFDKKTLNEKIAQRLAEVNPDLLGQLKAALTELEFTLDDLQGLNTFPFSHSFLSHFFPLIRTEREEEREREMKWYLREKETKISQFFVSFGGLVVESHLQMISSAASQKPPQTQPSASEQSKQKHKKDKKEEKESDKKAKKERKMREKMEREEQERLRRQQMKSRSISLETPNFYVDKKAETKIKKTKIQNKAEKAKKEEKKK
jgi:hypothetical protein